MLEMTEIDRAFVETEAVRLGLKGEWECCQERPEDG
jgi:hypothetical protein